MDVADGQAEQASAADAPAAQGYIGRIPVRNLWLLMLYASDLFRTGGSGRVGLEDSPDDLPDLVARILIEAVEQRRRRNLSAGYRSREAVLNRVRGRIDILKTERHQLLARGRVACRFDELTVDTPRNRFVRGALETIARMVKPESARRCSSLASAMKAMGVTGPAPTRAEMRAGHVGRNDASDRLMVDAAMLAMDLALPMESAGANELSLPDREVKAVRKLFEKAVGGFYDVVLRPQGWRVRRGHRLYWPVEQKTAGIDEILPNMETDIELDHVPSSRRIVIDTKFTSVVTRGRFRDQTLRSGYLYQIYAYLRSQAGRGDPLADGASGLLLHPSVGEDVDEAVLIQGHRIRFATVDLTVAPDAIRARLLAFCEPVPPVERVQAAGAINA